MSRRQRKTKRPVLDKASEARRAARQSGLRPAATRAIADKRRRPEKHRGRWIDDASE